MKLKKTMSVDVLNPLQRDLPFDDSKEVRVGAKKNWGHKKQVVVDGQQELTGVAAEE